MLGACTRLCWVGLLGSLLSCSHPDRTAKSPSGTDAGLSGAPTAHGGQDAAGGPPDAALPEGSLDAGPDGAGPDAAAPAIPGDAALPDAGGPRADAAAVEAGVDAGMPAVRLPPAGVGFDYQIGGAYPPPTGVAVVSRDREDSPAPGFYNVCYVNGFQVQQHEESFWASQHPELVLRNDAGEPVVDPGWDEWILDVGSAARRERIAAVVGAWIARCAADGFDAVEIDNLDSYSRSGGRLTRAHAVAFMGLLSRRAHREGLAIAQKNATELVSRRADMGTDFVVSEECDRWNECAAYTDAYGALVFDIEYPGGGYGEDDFRALCEREPRFSVVFRDLEVRPAGRAGYRYAACD